MNVILKQGREKIVERRHHWLFSGAIASYPDSYVDGEIAPIASHSGHHLGYGYFNRRCSLAGRIISFGSRDPYSALRATLREALALRRTLFDRNTTAYRLVNGEGDRLPGFILDKYGDYLVCQIGTLGMEKLLPFLLEELSQLNPAGIYEKSLLPSRKEEGLPPRELVHFGSIPDTIEILEEKSLFLVSILEGQKTGFFLDHRPMRRFVESLSANKRILNCFAYTGGFTVRALRGGATQVDSVDISKEAIALCSQNVALNGFEGGGFFAEDVFTFLRDRPLDYDLIILDPPAFAKRKEEVKGALRGYRDINRQALQRMPSGSLLLTCSCSYHVDASLFEGMCFEAALQAKRHVRILSRHHLAPDHPINLFHPEGDYLKSLLLYVT